MKRRQEGREVFRAVETISFMIIAGRAESGETLNVEDLSEITNLSRPVLRQGLAMLVSRGLVVLDDNGSFSVPPRNIEDYRETVAMRLLLEGTALRSSIGSGGDTWKKQLSEAFNDMQRWEFGRKETASGASHDKPDLDEFQRFISVYKRFHMLLISPCGFKSLIALIDAALDRNLRYAWQCSQFSNQQYIADDWKDVDGHLNILTAALRNDVEEAHEALRVHLFERATFVALSGRF